MSASPKFIVVHTAGAWNPKTRKVVHQRMEDIDRYHREHNGWRKIGYHIFIEEDGKARRGREDIEIPSSAAGFNKGTLAVCVSGHGDYAPFNAKQEVALITLCVQWCQKYGIKPEHVIGHRETDDHGGPPVYKTCPGSLIDMGLLRAKVAERLAEL
jgi:hypothetical protein